MVPVRQKDNLFNLVCMFPKELTQQYKQRNEGNEREGKREIERKHNKNK